MPEVDGANPYSSNPYPGLRPFETEEDYLFFGRDGQSEEILARLRRNRLIAVVGTSGSGKSSLIRAGLLPYLYGGFMSGAGSHWRVAVMRPGGDPIRNLAKMLSDPSVLARPTESEEEAQEQATLLEVTLRRSGLGLVEAVRHARLPEVENLLIVVDQFEELFRFAEPSKASRNEDDAAAFVKLLLEAADQSELPIYVVLTMRSDFIGDCARYRDLPEAVAGGLYLIPRMTRDQRREAIERPARVAESEISPRLMNRLLNDGGDNPDQLPILQHALMRTWNYWCGHRERGTQIDLDDYRAIGEMSEALSHHAEEAYAELPDERAREVAKRMFQALTEKGEDNREIRRPTSVGTIAAIAGATPAEVISVIEYFRKPGRSFLTPPADVLLVEGSVIDISHESLIRGWGRLNAWVDEETESAKVYKRLAETAALNDQGRAGLWHDPDLSYALAWREKEKPNAEWGQCYDPNFEGAMGFLERSAAARDAEIAERRRAKRVARNRNLAVAAAVLVCLAALGWWGFRSREMRQRLELAAAAEREKAKDEARERAQQEKLQEAHHLLQLATMQAEEKNAEEKSLHNQQEFEMETAWLQQVSRSADVSRVESNGWVNSLSSQLSEAGDVDQKAAMDSVRGTILSQMGEHTKAAQALSDALLLHPEQANLLDERAYEYILMGRPQDALTDLDAFLRVNPESANGRLNRVVALAMLKRYREAESELDRALDDFQFFSSGLFDSEISPDIKRATGQSNVAITALAFRVAMYYEAATLKGFAGDPGFVAALDRADRFARKEGFYPRTNGDGGKTNGSVDPFIAAIEWAWLSARGQDAGSGRMMRSDYGVYAAYGALWERAGRIQPKFTDWAAQFYQTFEATHARQRQPRYDWMAGWVRQQMAELYPGNTTPPTVVTEVMDVETLEDEASMLEEREDYDGSAKTLSQAIKLVENRPEDHSLLTLLLLRRAHVYRLAEKWKQAWADADRVLQYAPHTSEAYLYRGVSENDRSARIRDYKLAIHYDPLNRDARVFLAQTIREEDPKAAIGLLKEAIRVETPYAELYRDLATLQSGVGENQDALASIDAAIAHDPSQLGFYDTKATIMDRMKASKTDIALERAAGNRKVADYLAKTGRPEKALGVYLSGLRQLAESSGDSQDANIRAEEAVLAYDISELLERLGSRQDARQFWTTMQTAPYFKPMGEIAQHEVQRLSNP
jgi:tetratricopeptide (TPR) repeat protein